MKAGVIKSLVELKEAGEIPPLRINRFTPSDDLNKQEIAYVLEFLKFHKPDDSFECLMREVHSDLESLPPSGRLSYVAQKIGAPASDRGRK
jgi:hypothetical protein